MIKKILREIALFLCPEIGIQLRKFSQLTDDAIKEATAYRDMKARVEYTLVPMPSKDNEKEFIASLAGVAANTWVRAWFALQREALVRQLTEKGMPETYARYHGALIWLDQMKVDLDSYRVKAGNSEKV